MGENKGERNRAGEGERKEASLQHDVTLSAFKSPEQKGAAAMATNMDSRFNLPGKRTSRTVDLLSKPVPSVAHAALRLHLSHAYMHTYTRRHTRSEPADCTHRQRERGRETLATEQERNTNLVAIRDRSAARSS